MTHDPDGNCLMNPIPEVTDVFEYLMGEGFVMVASDRTGPMIPLKAPEITAAAGTREVWTGIEDDVRVLEGLLR